MFLYVSIGGGMMYVVGEESRCLAVGLVRGKDVIGMLCVSVCVCMYV